MIYTYKSLQSYVEFKKQYINSSTCTTRQMTDEEKIIYGIKEMGNT